ncbi:MAG TPA: TetR/AcrR family transcriptional regulator [Kofleriaceae bacterium]|jgi:AcrR family transcriptional regulator
MPRSKSPKSAETRAHILDVAKDLFGAKGFQATTLREIADRADVALGLTYRYFPQKQHLALALYGELADAFADATAHQKPASLADGFARAMRKKLELLAPHREAIAALFAASLTAADSVSIVGDTTRAIRDRVRGVFMGVAARATDLVGFAPDELATVLYGAHLLVVLAWLLDRDAKVTTYVTASHDVIAAATPFLALPPVRLALAQIARSLDSFLEGSS